jgi:hypothetical protein
VELLKERAKILKAIRALKGPWYFEVGGLPEPEAATREKGTQRSGTNLRRKFVAK